MKSIRLNKNLRAEIEDNIKQAYVLNSPEPDQGNPMDAFLAGIEKIYRVRSEALRVRAEEAGLLKHVKTNYTFMVAMPDMVVKHVYLKDSAGNRDTLVSVSPGAYFCNAVTGKTDKEISTVYTKYHADSKAERPNRVIHSNWVKDKANYMADIANVLNGVNTTRQLLEVWPECEYCLPKGIVNPSSINLPSVNIALLNKKIGL